MASSSGDSSSAHSSNPNANPTSEEGPVPVITLQEHMIMVRDFIHTLARIQSAKSINLMLPHFDPEIAGADPAAWCAAANQLMKDNPLQDSALISALKNALKGSAAYWFRQIVNGEALTWPMFMELFTTRFGGKETATSTLMSIFREKPQKNENIAAYFIRLRSLLEAKWQNVTKEEVINAIILCHLSRRDQRIKQIALEKDIKTKDQLLREMRDLDLTKRPASSTSNTSTSPEAKRYAED